MTDLTCCKCEASFAVTEFDGDEDEFLCPDCLQNQAEAAYERQQQADLESPPETAREEQLRTWEEHQRLHRR